MTVDPQLLTGLGAAAALFLSTTGSALASAHAGILAVRGSDYFHAFVPIVIAGVLSIYGLILAILLVGKIDDDMTVVAGYRNLSAGLACGLAQWASGWGISLFVKQLNESGKLTQSSTTGNGAPETESLLGRSYWQVTQPPFVKTALCLVFLEAIGLYGLIVGLFLVGK